MATDRGGLGGFGPSEIRGFGGMVSGFGGTGTVVWIWEIRQLSRFNGKDGWRAGAMEKCQRIGQPQEAEGAAGFKGVARLTRVRFVMGLHGTDSIGRHWACERGFGSGTGAGRTTEQRGCVKRIGLLDCGIRLRRTSTTIRRNDDKFILAVQITHVESGYAWEPAHVDEAPVYG